MEHGHGEGLIDESGLETFLSIRFWNQVEEVEGLP
jgi:hypothetical protein